jgi:hypothetical protein
MDILQITKKAGSRHGEDRPMLYPEIKAPGAFQKETDFL